MFDSTAGNKILPSLLNSYLSTRRRSEDLCQPLIIEDYVVQTMPDVSPPKWHQAHVSWFFETLVLVPYVKGYQIFNAQYRALFNSYYYGISEPFPRAQRGYLSRPSVAEIGDYRRYVDDHVCELLDSLEEFNDSQRIIELIVLGINHEQQHQELLMTDIKHIFSKNPLCPVYSESHRKTQEKISPALGWVRCSGGDALIGNEDQGFYFDNEAPQHRVYFDDYSLANRLVTNGDYLEFLADGGYQDPLLWLSDGWAAKNQHGWKAPLYWEKIEDLWYAMTLQGIKPIDPHEPVCHISYYEADAFAAWAGNRLPKETEWEVAATGCKMSGNFLESGRYHPRAANGDKGIQQMFGDVWEWTQSPYSPYPGYRIPKGAVGEYNGKFMCNQLVLRGGSCVTPEHHIRKTYRNFFYPHQRWQFMGFRLAKDS